MLVNSRCYPDEVIFNRHLADVSVLSGGRCFGKWSKININWCNLVSWLNRHNFTKICLTPEWPVLFLVQDGILLFGITINLDLETIMFKNTATRLVFETGVGQVTRLK